MTTALNEQDIEAALKDLPGWAYSSGKLTKTFKLNDFREALAFIVRIGLEAETANHHPELFNVYSTVEISLSTHDADGQVTQKDIDLAKAIQSVA